MTIIALEAPTLTPRQELVQEVMLALDGAITGDEPIGVHELAERIVTLVEESQSSA